MRVNSPITAVKYVLGAAVAVVAAAGLLIAQRAAVETASPGPDPGSPAYYEQYIQPVFQTRCLACHDGESKVSKLDMTTRAAMLTRRVFYQP